MLPWFYKQLPDLTTKETYILSADSLRLHGFRLFHGSLIKQLGFHPVRSTCKVGVVEGIFPPQTEETLVCYTPPLTTNKMKFHAIPAAIVARPAIEGADNKFRTTACFSFRLADS